VTPPSLMTALRSGADLDIVRTVLDADPAAIHRTDVEGRLPVHVAASLGDPTLVRLLIDRGADPNAPGPRRLRPVDRTGGPARPVGARRISAEDGWTPLHYACRPVAFEWDVMDRNLIEPDVIEPDSIEHEPIDPGVIEQGAIERGAIERGAIERGAIERGAIERGAIDQGAIELYVAVRGRSDMNIESRLETIRALLAFGANPDLGDGNGRSALHALASIPPELRERFDPEDALAARAAHLLLESGANPGQSPGPGRYLNTPLHRAAFHGRPAIVTALLAHGANPNPVDGRGLTPLDAADRAGERGRDCAAILLAHNALRRYNSSGIANRTRFKPS